MSLDSIRESLKKAIEMMDSISAYYNERKLTQHFPEKSVKKVTEIPCLGVENHNENVVVDESEQLHVVGNISLGFNMENTEISQTCQVVSNEDDCYVLGADVGLYLDDISTYLEEVEPCIEVESPPMLKEAKTQTLGLSLPTKATCEVKEKSKHDMGLKSDFFPAFGVSFEAYSTDLDHTHSYGKGAEVIGESEDSKWMGDDKESSVGMNIAFGFVASHINSEFCHGFNGESLILSSYIVMVFDPGGW